MHPITPDDLYMVEAIARHGSFAKAARELDKVPSAVTYAVRKLEDALDVLLFDRSGHRAQLTPAGQTLLTDGRQVLQSLDALAGRVKRVATGWELELRIAMSAALPLEPIYDVIAEFRELATVTTLQITTEVLSGTWDALASGRADLVIGADASGVPSNAYWSQPMGEMRFGFCVAPQHPLAQLQRPLTATDISAYCAVVIADTSRDIAPRTRGLLTQQPMIVMPTMQAKIDAQLRGLGCGYLPLRLAEPYLRQGTLVLCDTDDVVPITEQAVYAWRERKPGQALAWWLKKLQSPKLCEGLLGIHIARE